MSVSNTIMALDALTSLMTVSVKVAEIVSNAQREGRDVTDQELAIVIDERKKAVQDALNTP